MANLMRRNQNDLANLVEDFFRGFGSTGLEPWNKSTDFVPQINVSETNEQYKVVAELPGLEDKDFEVEIDNDVLRIKGEKKSSSESKDENEHFHRFESTYGSFERSIRLPETINADAAKASFKNGVLTLTIPKDKESSRVKKLKIDH
jgi:HSP20 family protein